MRLLTANDIEDEDDDENEHDRRIEEGGMQAGGDAMLYSFRALACGGGHSANRPRHAAQAEGHLRAQFRQRGGQDRR